MLTSFFTSLFIILNRAKLKCILKHLMLFLNHNAVKAKCYRKEITSFAIYLCFVFLFSVTLTGDVGKALHNSIFHI